MQKLDSRLILGLALAATIFAGLTVKGLPEVFAPFTLQALFIMIVASLIPMGRQQLGDIFSFEPDVLRTVFWQLFVLPSLMLAATHMLKVSPGVVKLMAVTACAGSLFASPALADLLGLNQRKALQCMVLSTFTMPLSYFLFFSLVMHSAVEVQVSEFIGRTGIFLMLPAAIFLFYSAFAEDMRETTARRVEQAARWVTVAALMVFGLGIVGPAATMLATQPERFAMLLVVVTLLGASMAILTTIVMYRQGITNALTASIVSGFRNVGLGFVLIQGTAADETAAYVGISQIPIFLAPLIMRLAISTAKDETDAEESNATHGQSAMQPLGSLRAL